MAPLPVDSNGSVVVGLVAFVASIGVISTLLIVLIGCACGGKKKEEGEAAKKGEEEVPKPAQQDEAPAEKTSSKKEAASVKKKTEKESPPPQASAKSELKSMMKSSIAMADAKTAVAPPELQYGKGPAFFQNFNQKKKMSDALACGPSPVAK